jgi:hypothetical protein
MNTMIDTDPYILAFFAWMRRNPITTAFLLIPALTWIAKKTKNKLDDWLVEKIKGASHE